MKWNESVGAKQCSNNPTPIYQLTEAGIMVKSKDYVDYLKESSYKESYKKFWTHLYLEQRGIDRQAVPNEALSTDQRRHRKY